MKTLFIFLLITLSVTAQKKMVLIEGFQNHEIEVSDSLTRATLKEFFGLAKVSRVDYETKLPQLKAVRTIDMNRNTLHSYKDGVIYINSYANQFPYSKRILILHELGLFYGAKATQGSSLDVMNGHFFLTEKYEENYKYRKKHRKDLKMLIKELEERNPLKTN